MNDIYLNMTKFYNLYPSLIKANKATPSKNHESFSYVAEIHKIIQENPAYTDRSIKLKSLFNITNGTQNAEFNNRY